MRKLPLLGLSFGCLVLAACGSAAPSTSSAPPAPSTSAAKPSVAANSGQAGRLAPLSPPVKVKIGVVGLAPEAGIFIAQERGYFNDEGLDTSIMPFRSASQQISLLATNQLQYGTGGPDPALFNANQRDVGLKIVTANATVTKDDRSAALIVRQDLIDSGRFKSVADLKGMTIALSIEGTTSQLYVDRILGMAKLTKADVTYTVVPFTDMMTALSNKAVDAAWEVEPFVSIAAAKKVAQSVVPMGEAYPGAVTEVIMMSPQFGKEQPEAAKRFMAAFLRGQRDYYSAFVGNVNPTARPGIIDILTKYTAVKDAKVYANLGMSGADPNGELDDKVLSQMQDYFVANGTQKQKVDLNKVVDHSYAQYAVARLGRM